MKIRYIIPLFIALFFSASTFAQKLEYEVDFGFNFDNLEGSLPYENTRTYMGAMIAPQIGFSLDEKNKVMVGGNLIQFMGDSLVPSLSDYTIYYKYDGENFNALLGAFPRSNSIATYPHSFFREDYSFYDPNMEGMMFQYENSKGSGIIELFLDWYGIDHEQRHDEFLFGGATRYYTGNRNFFFGANIMINHFNNEEALYLSDITSSADQCHLLERMQTYIYAGADLKPLLPTLDRLTLTLGLNNSAENKRFNEKESTWQHSPGLQLNLDANYKGFGIDNELYMGKSQFLYYGEYGSLFYMGSQFYRAKSYNRADLYYEKELGNISLRVDAIFHTTESGTANQQNITLKMKIDSRARLEFNL